jgi:pyruvate formate lyase activating enzyme
MCAVLAHFFKPAENGKIRCGLCPHRCTLAGGEGGLCGVRFNREGGGSLPFYGKLSSLALDPVEKKPLYHWRPASQILSAGFAGCNLRCPFCQNAHISQTTGCALRELSPDELVAQAVSANCGQVAFTYSEALVHAEYVMDCMALMRKAGIASVLVTNGCVGEEAAAEIFSLADAANIDLKCFSEETYKKLLGGSLSAVLKCIEIAFQKKVHIEITTLAVPGLNDGEDEMTQCADFIASLSADIPWHISAYHPAYQWNAPATKKESIIRMVKQAKEKLSYVYGGNIMGIDNDTVCSNCGSVLIKRTGYDIDISGIVKNEKDTTHYHCGQCSAVTPIKFKGRT